MEDEPLALLEVVAAPSRRRILALLAKGVDHPEELAKRLKLRRQGIDKQLMQLYEWGVVDRSAILPVGGRPRIVYRLSERGRELLGRAETMTKEYKESLRAEYQGSLAALEDKLAAGELDEDAYKKKVDDVKRRYSGIFEPGPAGSRGPSTR